MSPIAPHGGTLIDRAAPAEEALRLAREAEGLASVTLSPAEACDLEMIATGAFSPLIGFQGRGDFERVCRDARLADGTVWPVPVVLAPTDPAVAEQVGAGDRVALRDDPGRLLAVLTVTETFRRDVALEASGVYGTTDAAHPGIAAVRATGRVCLAGPVDVVRPAHDPEFADLRLTPRQTRAAFAERGWATVAAFQTRNPIHRSHEYLTKVALELTDGLLIHPVVGAAKADDVPADVRVRCYRALLDHYYNPAHAMLAVTPLAMRYAGPREAVLHALVRKNHGATHFIVGRDHAGAGDYYGTYDAQRIFDQFDPAEIGIVPLRFENAFYCGRARQVASSKTTGGGPADRIMLSGTRLREMLRAGQRPPEEFTRPEVADVLVAWARSLPPESAPGTASTVTISAPAGVQ
ncbi:MAG TPA: sulfate adenylyltransferase [Tepidisphaeraceae bacterium]|nr:sulfate adenylyltransferase [Tepidisphaeraceae bacterium]